MALYFSSSKSALLMSFKMYFSDIVICISVITMLSLNMASYCVLFTDKIAWLGTQNQSKSFAAPTPQLPRCCPSSQFT